MNYNNRDDVAAVLTAKINDLNLFCIANKVPAVFMYAIEKNGKTKTVNTVRFIGSHAPSNSNLSFDLLYHSSLSVSTAGETAGAGSAGALSELGYQNCPLDRGKPKCYHVF